MIPNAMLFDVLIDCAIGISCGNCSINAIHEFTPIIGTNFMTIVDGLNELMIWLHRYA